MAKMNKLLRIKIGKVFKTARVGVDDGNPESRLVQVTEIPRIGGVYALKSGPT